LNLICNDHLKLTEFLVRDFFYPGAAVSTKGNHPLEMANITNVNLALYVTMCTAISHVLPVQQSMAYAFITASLVIFTTAHQNLCFQKFSNFKLEFFYTNFFNCCIAINFSQFLCAKYPGHLTWLAVAAWS
jgi:hypothetical protein